VRVAASSRQLQRSGRIGPLCLACGNKQRFWVQTPSETRLADLDDVLEGDVRILACGRCRSRHSLVMARVD
jgi:hypothetical protein